MNLATTTLSSEKVDENKSLVDFIETQPLDNYTSIFRIPQHDDFLFYEFSGTTYYATLKHEESYLDLVVKKHTSRFRLFNMEFNKEVIYFLDIKKISKYEPAIFATFQDDNSKKVYEKIDQMYAKRLMSER